MPVNQRVTGSSPVRGAKRDKAFKGKAFRGFAVFISYINSCGYLIG